MFDKKSWVQQHDFTFRNSEESFRHADTVFLQIVVTEIYYEEQITKLIGKLIRLAGIFVTKIWHEYVCIEIYHSVIYL